MAQLFDDEQLTLGLNLRVTGKETVAAADDAIKRLSTDLDEALKKAVQTTSMFRQLNQQTSDLARNAGSASNAISTIRAVMQPAGSGIDIENERRWLEQVQRTNAANIAGLRRESAPQSLGPVPSALPRPPVIAGLVPQTVVKEQGEVPHHIEAMARSKALSILEEARTFAGDLTAQRSNKQDAWKYDPTEKIVHLSDVIKGLDDTLVGKLTKIIEQHGNPKTASTTILGKGEESAVFDIGRGRVAKLRPEYDRYEGEEHRQQLRRFESVLGRRANPAIAEDAYSNESGALSVEVFRKMRPHAATREADQRIAYEIYKETGAIPDFEGQRNFGQARVGGVLKVIDSGLGIPRPTPAQVLENFWSVPGFAPPGQFTKQEIKAQAWERGKPPMGPMPSKFEQLGGRILTKVWPDTGHVTALAVHPEANVQGNLTEAVAGEMGLPQMGLAPHNVVGASLLRPIEPLGTKVQVPGNVLLPGSTEVAENYQRQGIATAMYDRAAHELSKIMGGLAAVVPGEDRSSGANKFWQHRDPQLLAKAKQLDALREQVDGLYRKLTRTGPNNDRRPAIWSQVEEAQNKADALLAEMGRHALSRELATGTIDRLDAALAPRDLNALIGARDTLYHGTTPKGLKGILKSGRIKDLSHQPDEYNDDLVNEEPPGVSLSRVPRGKFGVTRELPILLELDKKSVGRTTPFMSSPYSKSRLSYEFEERTLGTSVDLHGLRRIILDKEQLAKHVESYRDSYKLNGPYSPIEDRFGFLKPGPTAEKDVDKLIGRVRTLAQSKGVHLDEFDRTSEVAAIRAAKLRDTVGRLDAALAPPMSSADRRVFAPSTFGIANRQEVVEAFRNSIQPADEYFREIDGPKAIPAGQHAPLLDAFSAISKEGISRDVLDKLRNVFFRVKRPQEFDPKTNPNADGSYFRGQNSIVVDPASGTRTWVHEIGHALQHLTGFKGNVDRPSNFGDTIDLRGYTIKNLVNERFAEVLANIGTGLSYHNTQRANQEMGLILRGSGTFNHGDLVNRQISKLADAARKFYLVAPPHEEDEKYARSGFIASGDPEFYLQHRKFFHDVYDEEHGLESLVEPELAKAAIGAVFQQQLRRARADQAAQKQHASAKRKAGIGPSQEEAERPDSRGPELEASFIRPQEPQSIWGSRYEPPVPQAIPPASVTQSDLAKVFRPSTQGMAEPREVAYSFARMMPDQKDWTRPQVLEAIGDIAKVGISREVLGKLESSGTTLRMVPPAKMWGPGAAGMVGAHDPVEHKIAVDPKRSGAAEVLHEVGHAVQETTGFEGNLDDPEHFGEWASRGYDTPHKVVREKFAETFKNLYSGAAANAPRAHAEMRALTMGSGQFDAGDLLQRQAGRYAESLRQGSLARQHEEVSTLEKMLGRSVGPGLDAAMAPVQGPRELFQPSRLGMADPQTIIRAFNRIVPNDTQRRVPQVEEAFHRLNRGGISREVLNQLTRSRLQILGARPSEVLGPGFNAADGVFDAHYHALDERTGRLRTSPMIVVDPAASPKTVLHEIGHAVRHFTGFRGNFDEPRNLATDLDLKAYRPMGLLDERFAESFANMYSGTRELNSPRATTELYSIASGSGKLDQHAVLERQKNRYASQLRKYFMRAGVGKRLDMDQYEEARELDPQLHAEELGFVDAKHAWSSSFFKIIKARNQFIRETHEEFKGQHQELARTMGQFNVERLDAAMRDPKTGRFIKTDEQKQAQSESKQEQLEPKSKLEQPRVIGGASFFRDLGFKELIDQQKALAQQLKENASPGILKQVLENYRQLIKQVPATAGAVPGVVPGFVGTQGRAGFPPRVVPAEGEKDLGPPPTFGAQPPRRGPGPPSPTAVVGTRGNEEREKEERRQLEELDRVNRVLPMSSAPTGTRSQGFFPSGLGSGPMAPGPTPYPGSFSGTRGDEERASEDRRLREDLGKVARALPASSTSGTRYSGFFPSGSGAGSIPPGAPPYIGNVTGTGGGALPPQGPPPPGFWARLFGRGGGAASPPFNPMAPAAPPGMPPQPPGGQPPGGQPPGQQPGGSMRFPFGDGGFALATLLGYGAALRGLIVNIVEYSARTQTMEMVTKQMAVANGLNTNAVLAEVDAVKQYNMTTQAAHATVQRMMLAQLDVAKAPQVAQIAQNIAAVAGVAPQEAMERMIVGITSGYTRSLHQMGLQVNQLAAIRQLTAERRGQGIEGPPTEYEKRQELLNQVILAGSAAMGTYQKSLLTAGGQFTLLSRDAQETANVIGHEFLPTYGRFITTLDKGLQIIQSHAEGTHTALSVLAAAFTGIAANRGIALIASMFAGGLGGPVGIGVAALTALATYKILNQDPVEAATKTNQDVQKRASDQIIQLRKERSQLWAMPDHNTKEWQTSWDANTASLRSMSAAQLDIQRNLTEQLAAEYNKRLRDYKSFTDGQAQSRKSGEFSVRTKPPEMPWSTFIGHEVFGQFAPKSILATISGRKEQYEREWLERHTPKVPSALGSPEKAVMDEATLQRENERRRMLYPELVNKERQQAQFMVSQMIEAETKMEKLDEAYSEGGRKFSKANEAFLSPRQRIQIDTREQVGNIERLTKSFTDLQAKASSGDSTAKTQLKNIANTLSPGDIEMGMTKIREFLSNSGKVVAQIREDETTQLASLTNQTEQHIQQIKEQVELEKVRGAIVKGNHESEVRAINDEYNIRASTAQRIFSMTKTREAPGGDTDALQKSLAQAETDRQTAMVRLQIEEKNARARRTEDSAKDSGQFYRQQVLMSPTRDYRGALMEGWHREIEATKSITNEQDRLNERIRITRQLRDDLVRLAQEEARSRAEGQVQRMESWVNLQSTIDSAVNLKQRSGEPDPYGEIQRNLMRQIELAQQTYKIMQPVTPAANQAALSQQRETDIQKAKDASLAATVEQREHDVEQRRSEAVEDLRFTGEREARLLELESPARLEHERIRSGFGGRFFRGGSGPTSVKSDVISGELQESEAAHNAFIMRKSYIEQEFELRGKGLEAEKQARREMLSAEFEELQRLVEQQRRGIQETRDFAGGLFDAMTSHGQTSIGQFIAGEFKGQARTMFQNAFQLVAGNMHDRLGKAFPGQETVDAEGNRHPTVLGKILSGSWFGVTHPEDIGKLQADITARNTDAQRALTVAIQQLDEAVRAAQYNPPWARQEPTGAQQGQPQMMQIAQVPWVPMPQDMPELSKMAPTVPWSPMPQEMPELSKLAPTVPWSPMPATVEGQKVLVDLPTAISRYEGFGANPTNIPTRNNNPGDIKFGDFAKQYGATKDPKSEFAMFPTPDVGFKAMQDLLGSNAYKDLSLDQAIRKWNGADQPNNQQYVSYISKMTGIAPDASIRGAVPGTAPAPPANDQGSTGLVDALRANIESQKALSEAITSLDSAVRTATGEQLGTGEAAVPFASAGTAVMGPAALNGPSGTRPGQQAQGLQQPTAQMFPIPGISAPAPEKVEKGEDVPQASSQQGPQTVPATIGAQSVSAIPVVAAQAPTQASQAPEYSYTRPAGVQSAEPQQPGSFGMVARAPASTSSAPATREQLTALESMFPGSTNLTPAPQGAPAWEQISGAGFAVGANALSIISSRGVSNNISAAPSFSSHTPGHTVGGVGTHGGGGAMALDILMGAAMGGSAILPTIARYLQQRKMKAQRAAAFRAQMAKTGEQMGVAGPITPASTEQDTNKDLVPPPSSADFEPLGDYTRTQRTPTDDYRVPPYDMQLDALERNPEFRRLEAQHPTYLTDSETRGGKGYVWDTRPTEYIYRVGSANGMIPAQVPQPSPLPQPSAIVTDKITYGPPVDVGDTLRGTGSGISGSTAAPLNLLGGSGGLASYSLFPTAQDIGPTALAPNTSPQSTQEIVPPWATTIGSPQPQEIPVVQTPYQGGLNIPQEQQDLQTAMGGGQSSQGGVAPQGYADQSSNYGKGVPLPEPGSAGGFGGFLQEMPSNLHILQTAFGKMGGGSGGSGGIFGSFLGKSSGTNAGMATKGAYVGTDPESGAPLYSGGIPGSKNNSSGEAAGTGPFSSVSAGIGTGLQVYGGVMQAISGFKQGGAKGIASGIGGTLMAVAPFTGPAAPFVMAGAAVADIVSSFLPDPKLQRQHDIQTWMNQNKYIAPVQIQNIDGSSAGNVVSYGMGGRVRDSGVGMFPLDIMQNQWRLQQQKLGLFQSTHSYDPYVYLPGNAMINQNNAPARQVSLTMPITVHTMDSKSFLDNSDKITSAVNQQALNGNPFGISLQNLIFGQG